MIKWLVAGCVLALSGGFANAGSFNPLFSEAFSISPTPLPPGDFLEVGVDLLGIPKPRDPSLPPVTFFANYQGNALVLDSSLNDLLNISLDISWICSLPQSCGSPPPATEANVAIPTTAAYIEFVFSSFTFDQYENWSAIGSISDSDGVIQLTEGLLPTPLPAALPLFSSGLCAFGLLGWRRKRRTALSS